MWGLRLRTVGSPDTAKFVGAAFLRFMQQSRLFRKVITTTQWVQPEVHTGYFNYTQLSLSWEANSRSVTRNSGICGNETSTYLGFPVYILDKLFFHLLLMNWAPTLYTCILENHSRVTRNSE